MDIALPALLENNLGVAIFTGLFALLGFAIKILKGAFDFHYDYFTRRHLRRVTDLLPLVEADSLAHHYLKETINGEVFKIASGLKTTNRRASALMQLCKFQRISANQVKLFARNIELGNDGKVSISINNWDKLAAGYSAVASTVMFIFGLYAFITSFSIDSEYGWVAGAVVFLLCILAVRVFITDFRSYQLLKIVRNDLQDKPLPPCKECHTDIDATLTQDSSPTLHQDNQALITSRHIVETPTLST
jgi:hypothetical protein